MTSRIIPGDATDPGAQEAQVTTYIDRTLAGYFSSLQVFYREGIDALEKFCTMLHGASFTELPAAKQDEILRAVEGRTGDDEGDLLAQFFAVVYEHTLEGMFGDPVYGGNRNAVGWKLIGFPGAQWGYSPAEMAAGFDATTIPVRKLSDLQAEGRTTSPISLQWPPTAM
jgi:gluconate 2-dehydrogenase gamma chain